jgi:hypothetical protein
MSIFLLYLKRSNNGVYIVYILYLELILRQKRLVRLSALSEKANGGNRVRKIAVDRGRKIGGDRGRKAF